MLIKVILVGLTLLIGGCTTKSGSYSYQSLKPSQKYPSQQLAMNSSSVYKPNGELHATMRPYTVMGKEYCPTVVRVGDTFSGRASWYGNDFHGKSTSNGEGYDMYSMTAAHKTLPMNTVVRVTNTDNGSQAIVRINDRGPFVETRIIDLSYAAAQQIGVAQKGTANVTLEVLGFEPSSSRGIDMQAIAKGPKESVLNNFFVQIGSFERFEGASLTKQKYASFNGYSAIIKDTEYNNKRLFRVWLSGFKSEAEARDFISKGYFQGSFIIGE
ncbi:MAG: septal ring lytic transglycosylase RlpA family protein [Sulfuricurvum sp.]|uniref:septal ring lytic transglycosylase RlpA family protein n=1 Tax=Sulfuricurvum sp. TaxID=2025608 RepID=UPI00261B7FD2|nr:septal ring lytic transglycosylase RlpA family protein [Sulfuricurvum sp.]MDD5160046.1 septal ring lytic transglycosylase RlpA family protein [Sulfuricurvum sp.]